MLVSGMIMAFIFPLLPVFFFLAIISPFLFIIFCRPGHLTRRDRRRVGSHGLQKILLDLHQMIYPQMSQIIKKPFVFVYFKPSALICVICGLALHLFLNLHHWTIRGKYEYPIFNVQYPMSKGESKHEYPTFNVQCPRKKWNVSCSPLFLHGSLNVKHSLLNIVYSSLFLTFIIGWVT
jgi:hypothetical protein